MWVFIDLFEPDFLSFLVSLTSYVSAFEKNSPRALLRVRDKPEEAGRFLTQHGSEYDGKFLSIGKALRAP